VGQACAGVLEVQCSAIDAKLNLAKSKNSYCGFSIDHNEIVVSFREQHVAVVCMPLRTSVDLEVQSVRKAGAFWSVRFPLIHNQLECGLDRKRR
jgi:hypothetical protein